MNRVLFLLALLALIPMASAQTTQPTTGGAVSPTVSADQMLREMLGQDGAAARPLQPVRTAPAVDKTTGAGSVAPDAEPITVMREGTFLVERVGRLTRSADGQQMEFTFEADGQTLQDPPVIILPSLKLMAMENAITTSRRDLKFRITGMLTEYQGRNYVLLESVVVVPENRG